jgi:hypothetical protein
LREDGPLGPDVELSLFVIITSLLRSFCSVYLFLLPACPIDTHTAEFFEALIRFSKTFVTECDKAFTITSNHTALKLPLLLLLLLLLHPLYFPPHQVSRFSQHRDRVALLRSLEFQHVLHLPDALKCARQPL